MTTQTLVAMDIGESRIPWDSFIERELRRHGVLENVLESRVEAIRPHIEAFRRTEWPTMCRELKGYGLAWPEQVQPHWVAPRSAVLWQPMYQMEVDEAKGRLTRRYIGWEPTTGLPIGNANQLAYYLKKGLRIRPPLGTVVEASLIESVEAAPPSLASGDSRGDRPVAPTDPASGPSEEYTCSRHPASPGRSGVYRTSHWREYRGHCSEHHEPLQQEPPREVKHSLRQWNYVCPGCWLGFPNTKLARRHFMHFANAPDGMRHAPPEAMVECSIKLRKEWAADYEAAQKENNG